MTESLHTTELRRDIAEVEAQRNCLSPVLAEQMLSALLSDLAVELARSLAPAVRPTPKPISLSRSAS